VPLIQPLHHNKVHETANLNGQVCVCIWVCIVIDCSGIAAVSRQPSGDGCHLCRNIASRIRSFSRPPRRDSQQNWVPVHVLFESPGERYRVLVFIGAARLSVPLLSLLFSLLFLQYVALEMVIFMVLAL